MKRIGTLLAATSLVVLALVLVNGTTRTEEPNSGSAAGSGTRASVGQPRPRSPVPTRSARSAPRSHAISGRFRLVIHTAASVIDVAAAPLSVASHQPVDPPHNTAREWDTAAWIVQSTYPTRPNRGTAYIYGHACEDYVCAFNDLKDARVGDTARITTRGARMTYRVDRIGLGVKTANSLPDWASDSTVPDRIVLVTCSYEPDGESVYNLVVIAHLMHQAGRLTRR